MKPKLYAQDNTATLYWQSWDLTHMQVYTGAASCSVFNDKAATAKTGGAVQELLWNLMQGGVWNPSLPLASTGS